MPKINWKKEIFTIPNFLSLFRLVLIPVYVYIYLNATEDYHYTIAASVLAVSCLTDLIDGKIARRFNMISNLGKLLDPIADKATQFAMMICLSQARPSLRALLVLFLVKEFFQLFATVLNASKGQVLEGALMSGKVSTTVLFICLIIMVFNPDLSHSVVNLMTGICAVFLTIAFVDYFRAFFGKNNKLHAMEEDL